ncbi:MAG: hypothetical protein EON54_20335 [Alcaligenaceae bacterium]|nr:MAG: hypothetical protein EON54_20335 [Alcaligenaceae bacterium]
MHDFTHVRIVGNLHLTQVGPSLAMRLCIAPYFDVQESLEAVGIRSHQTVQGVGAVLFRLQKRDGENRGELGFALLKVKKLTCKDWLDPALRPDQADALCRLPKQ